jgi:hypothetical protein
MTEACAHIGQLASSCHHAAAINAKLATDDTEWDMQPVTGHVLTQSADFKTEWCELSCNPYLQDIAEL